jgi:hypothetical protein
MLEFSDLLLSKDNHHARKSTRKKQQREEKVLVRPRIEPVQVASLEPSLCRDFPGNRHLQSYCIKYRSENGEMNSSHDLQKLFQTLSSLH